MSALHHVSFLAFASLAPSLPASAQGTVPGKPADDGQVASEDRDGSVVPASASPYPEAEERDASSVFKLLEKLQGRWKAKGDGFETRLDYQLVLPDHAMTSSNELKNAAGATFARYFGLYFANYGRNQVEFRAIKEGGELHSGTVYVIGDELWHDATVNGGSVKEYRSVMKRSGDTIEYRANYGTISSHEFVRRQPRLVYSLTTD